MKEKIAADNCYKILTNYEGDNDPNWKPYVDYIPPPERNLWTKKIPLIGGYIYSGYHALLMYRKRRKYDLILLACSRSGVIFSILQFLFFFNRKPVFYFSNLWERHSNDLLYYFKYFQIFIINKSAIGYSLYSSCDIDSYSKTFPIKKNKFTCIPFFPTLWKYNYEVSDAGFIFSGGNGQRDYRQLIKAAKGLPYKFFIATTDNKLLDGLEIPNNVTVKGVSPQQFRQLMASATIHIVAMAGGFLRSGGHQTYLNAMVMGKAVIVTDTRGTADYIEDGVTGILLEPGNISGLKNAIIKLMENEDYRKMIGRNAKIKSKQFNGSLYLKKLRLTAIAKLSNANMS